MPIYDYSCEDCKHVEEIVSTKILKETDVLTCPKCEGNNFKRVWSIDGGKTNFGLKSWREGLSTSQQASALLERGRIDGKREI